MTRAGVAAFPASVRGNPYCDLLYGHLERLGVDVTRDAALSPWWLVRHARRVKVLHLHWPEFYYRTGGRPTVRSVGAFVTALLIARLLDYRLVWTVHNALPHERHAVDRALRWLLLRWARLVVHGAAARAALPPTRRPPAVVPHGNYIGCYPDDCTPADARRMLGLAPQHRVFLCFGQVRAYKGLDRLLTAFAAVPGADLRLVIAGRPGTDADAHAVLAAAGRDPRVRTCLRWIADDEVQVFFRAADVVVLPYLAILTSGVALLALSFGRPCIVPRLGCLGELEADGCALGFDPDDPDGLRTALADAAQRQGDGWQRRALAAAHGRAWEPIAAAYARLYREE